MESSRVTFERRHVKPSALPILAAILIVGVAIWGAMRYYEGQRLAARLEMQRQHQSDLLRAELSRIIAEFGRLGDRWAGNDRQAEAEARTLAASMPGVLGLIFLSRDLVPEVVIAVGSESPMDSLQSSRTALGEAQENGTPVLTKAIIPDNLETSGRFSVAIPLNGPEGAKPMALAVFAVPSFARIATVGPGRPGEALRIPTYGSALTIPLLGQTGPGAEEPTSLPALVAALATVLLLTFAGFYLNREEEARKTAEQKERHNAQLKDYADRLESEILERRLAEAEVNRARAATGRFLGTMRHEIRASLDVAIALFRAIKNDEAAEHDPKSLAARGLDTSQRLMGQLTNVLDASRLDAGAMKLAPAEADLNCLIETWSRHLETVCDASGKSIETQVLKGDQLPGRVVLDSVRVSQIVTNLLTNAVNFTPSGTVTLQVGFVPGSANVLVIKVSDTGPGISEERRETLFERFYQHPRPICADADRKTPGLGLSICRDLAGLMGGSLSFEDRPGGGTVFNLRLYNVAAVLRAAS